MNRGARLLQRRIWHPIYSNLALAVYRMFNSITPLCPNSVPWTRIPIESASLGGTKFTKWAPYAMPQLGKYKFLLDTVLFLYPSRESAEKGEDFGGSGFLVGVPSNRWPDHYHHVYAVTNWHVAHKGSPVVRVNLVRGKTDIFELESSDWHFIPRKHDIAVAPINLQSNIHKVGALGPQWFLSEQEKTRLDVGAGDDVFMVGRFIDHGGIETNEPSLRFGHISISSAMIEETTGYVGENYVIDLHSRSGYSGSPVFVYRTHGSIFPDEKSLVFGGHTMKLLGIHWGQFPEEWELKDKSLAKQHIKGMSGMTCVCPASAIQEVLELPLLRDMRERTDDDLEYRLTKEGGTPPVAEIADAP
jgi:hypothetical protein